MMATDAWYNQLTVGDKVIVTKDGIVRRRAVATVIRLLPSQIIVQSKNTEWRFLRRNGAEFGGDRYHGASMMPYTDTEAAAIRLKNRKHRLYDWCQSTRYDTFAHLTIEQCTDLWHVLVTLGLTTKE